MTRHVIAMPRPRPHPARPFPNLRGSPMNMRNQNAALFKSLHQPGNPLVLFNAWDAGSARAVAEAGASAIATGSWAVAAANGFSDGESLPLPLALENLRRVVATVELPVTVDLEAGYAENAGGVGRTVEAAIDAGAVGCNLEDGLPGDGRLRDGVTAARRIAAAQDAARSVAGGFFINARTDVFFQKPADAHDATMVDAALERARAYADAGADGLFVPGLVDDALIARLVEGSPLPVNIMVVPEASTRARLAELGVARISHGPGPYLGAMGWLTAEARKAMA